MLPPSLPAVPMQAAVKGPERSPGVLLAQAPAGAGQAIPAEVQGWSAAAEAAAAKGDTATALRLQKQVVAWLEANRPAKDEFRAGALLLLGLRLAADGRGQEALAPTEDGLKISRELPKANPAFKSLLAISLTSLGAVLGSLNRHQEALAPTEEAVKVFRELAKTNQVLRRALGASLMGLGMVLNELGRRQESLASTEEAIEIQRELAKTNPAVLPDLANSLNNLGVDYSDLGRRQEALAPTEEAVKIRRELAKTNPAFLNDLATSLNNLGIRYSDLGRRQEALAPTEEAVKIRRKLAKTKPANQGDLARSLINLSEAFSELGRHQEALAPMEEAVKLYRQLTKTNPAVLPDLASSLNNLGIRYSDLGRRQEALAPTEEAVKIRRELAKTNPAVLNDLASSLNNLGVRYTDLGRRQEALTATEESLKIRRELAKTNPAVLPDLASSLNNLGLSYSDLGRRQEALAATEESLKIRRELAKTNQTVLNDLASSLNNLGIRYSDLGRRKEALAPTEEAVKIRRELAKTNPAVLPDLAISLNNLGIRYSELGRRQEALAATEESLKIRRELAKTNLAVLPDLADSLSNLGVEYIRLGRRQEALAPTEEALKIRRELAKTNPAFLGDLASSLNNLGTLLSELGRRQEALAPTEEAVKIRRELAKTNPAFLENLALNATNLAILQLQLANPRAALPLLRESVSTEVTYLQGQLPLLPEARRLALVEVFGDRWQIPFSQAQQGEAGAALALFTRLNRQGLLQDIQRSQALLARSGPQRVLFEQLTLVTAQLASTTLTPQQQAPLLARKEQLEQEIYRQLPQIQPRLVEPRQIAALLPAGGVLVEFQRLRIFDNNTKFFGPPRYLALLLRPDGTIRAIPLGEAAPIDAAVAAAVAASSDANQQAGAAEKLAAVSKLVLAPLQRELAGVRELFVSPDGELNRLPFAALPVAGPKDGGIADGPITADGRTLGAAVALRLLTTGRDLLRLQQPAKAGAAPVLIVNPDFNAASRSAKGGASATTAASTAEEAGGPTALRGGQQRSPGVRGLTAWQPLGGTEQEARQLAPLLGSGAVISGPAATAEVVLAQRAPRILHIATHGFFLADQAPTNDTAIGAAAPGSRSGGAPSEGTAAATPSREDPLQRSGLVFAGANRPAANPSDDGYLTAAEATAMDLEGTELVTLSACETGLGGVQSGEGVYGLQRSLAVAGARSTLLSLWKVDDGLTVAFMEHYYKRLKAGEGRADALRSTQNDFRENKNSNYHDIRVWGAFQLSGDWRALPKW
jgi:tetratricopeptide (TPR) repeat protein/CHAT domain-containing protein